MGCLSPGQPRPYKRTHFPRASRKPCGAFDNLRPPLIRAIEKEIFILIASVTGKADFRIFSFEGRCVVFRLLKSAQKLRGAAKEPYGGWQRRHRASRAFFMTRG